MSLKNHLNGPHKNYAWPNSQKDTLNGFGEGVTASFSSNSPQTQILSEHYSGTMIRFSRKFQGSHIIILEKSNDIEKEVAPI